MRSSNARTSRSTTTAYRPSLPPKCSYTTGLETFARAATSSIEVASKPRSANSCRPIAMSCSRRCADDIRTREPDFCVDARVEVEAVRSAGSSVTGLSCQPLGLEPVPLGPADVRRPAELLEDPDQPRVQV